jgi:23S rRNA pseudouridine1911/1915/1917 synthase
VEAGVISKFMNKKNEMTAFVVARGEDGASVQDFLSAKLSISRRAAKNLLDERVVWVNRRCIWMAHHRLRNGDTIEIPSRRQTTVTIGNRIRVLVESGDYLVVDKPSGLVVTGSRSVETMLREQLSSPKLVVVHRLDKDTTGCLLCARSSAAFEAAVKLFKSRRVIKLYQALVYGKFESKASLLNQKLDGERAISQVKRLTCVKEASFLKIRIETGRTHQIRRHLAAVRHPVLGDIRYGIKTVRDPRYQTIPRPMLHACGLELVNPLEPTLKIKAHSPLPADFRRSLKLFGMGR